MLIELVKPTGHYLSETKIISISSCGTVMFTIGCEVCSDGSKVISISSDGIVTEAWTAIEGEPEQQKPTKQRKIEVSKSLSVIRTPTKK